MKRRDLLLGTGALMTMSNFGGCAPAQSTALPAAYEPVRRVLTEQIAQHVFPGSVFLIAKDGTLAARADGKAALEGDAPMRRDAIFRIASMSKAVTAAAIMLLIEDGKLTLEEKAERLLPELANRRVLRTLSSDLDDTVPAAHAITIREIMNFTFGLGINFDQTLPINQAAERNQLQLGAPVPMTPHAPDEWMARFATLPLMHQPGERWLYNVGSLLQGVLVARASGQDFDSFVEERIAGPLGMADTGFFVPANKLERLAGCGIYTDPATRQQTRMDRDGAQSAYATRPVFPSGAAGLCSTADDYLAFARMLLAGGEHNGRRLLEAASVRAMTTNQLSDAQRAASARSLVPAMFDTAGWGFGVGVQVAANGDTQAPGAYGWDGGFGTSWFNDPNRNLVSIVMTQSSDFLFNGTLQRYRSAVYAATV